MKDKEAQLIWETLHNESLIGRAKDTVRDVAKELDIADKIYQSLSTEKDPSQITDDDIDEIVLRWIGKQEWIPADSVDGLSGYLGQYLKNRRDKDASASGDAYGRSSNELPFSR
tara:strand:- start:699 stop:1040 length:342 start_codon:yes stop_codon:yes gene_type:complete